MLVRADFFTWMATIKGPKRRYQQQNADSTQEKVTRADSRGTFLAHTSLQYHGSTLSLKESRRSDIRSVNPSLRGGFGQPDGSSSGGSGQAVPSVKSPPMRAAN